MKYIPNRINPFPINSIIEFFSLLFCNIYPLIKPDDVKELLLGSLPYTLNNWQMAGAARKKHGSR